MMAYEEAELRIGIIETFEEASRIGLREFFPGRSFRRVGKEPKPRREVKRPSCPVCGGRALAHRCLDAPLIMSFPVGRFG